MSTLTRTPRRHHAGFTLIELLVAIAILGILGTVVVQTVWGYIDDANQTGTKTKLAQIKDKLMMYRRKHQDVPDSLTTLLEEDQANNMKPWLTEDEIKDSWGREMIIKRGDKPGEFEVISLGEDGQENGFDASLGTARDISSDRPLEEATDK